MKCISLFLPVFTVVGFTVGYLGVPNLLNSRVLVGVGTALFGGLVVFFGGVLLALVDYRWLEARPNCATTPDSPTASTPIFSTASPHSRNE